MTSHTAAPASPPAPESGPAPATADGSRSAATSVLRSPIASPLRVLLTIAQLAALGLVGPVVFTLLITLLSTGIGLAVVLGIGLLLLIAFVYTLWAVAWVEAARVDGLYHVGVPAPALRRPPRPGFGGVMLMFWRQAIDPGVWRGIANFAIATVLGLVTIMLVAVLVSGIALTLSPLLVGEGVSRLWGWDLELPLTWAFVVGPVMVALSAAALIGVAILHGVLSRLIMVPSREAQLAAQARQSAEQRAGAVRAADVERTRIERDLHDGVQPRLVSVGMTLGLARQKIEDDPAAATALIEEAHTSTKAAITELRQLARGIHASVLDDRGLDAALSALAARSHVPVQLDVRIEG
ncbi:sensor histidine kinase, partial [Microbacterium lushaniae]